MKTIYYSIIALCLAGLFIFQTAISRPLDKNSTPLIQKTITSLYDIQQNDSGNVSFFATNYGISNLDIRNSRGGCYWPRNSQNQYIFASGIWLGAQKSIGTNLAKLVEISYNPNSGISWMVPGMIADGDAIDTTDVNKYRLHFSTDYNSDGTPKNSDNIYNWPLWVTDKSDKNIFSSYPCVFAGNPQTRNYVKYPFGPEMISSQDMVCIFKDSDLNYYEGGAVSRKAEGFPLHLQYLQRTYTWNSEDLKDVVVVAYDIENKSADTLYNCWIGGVFDTDLALKSNAQQGATNDRVKTYNEGDSLVMSVSWTNGDMGEKGKGFGYIGFHLVESPATDANGWLLPPQEAFLSKNQMGLKTNRNWSIEEDLTQSDARYNFMSSALLDQDNGSGDKRILMASGPFNFRPGEKTKLTFCIAFALPAKGDEADGTDEDISGIKGIAGDGGKSGSGEIQTTTSTVSLAQKIRKVREYYYKGVISSVESNSSDELSMLSISQAYPNPVRQALSLRFRQLAAGRTSAVLVDQAGRLVSQLFAKDYDSGEHTEQIIIDKFSLNSGAYYVRLQSGKSISVAKIIIE